MKNQDVKINQIKQLFKREEEINILLIKYLSDLLEHWAQTEHKIQNFKLIWNRDGLQVLALNNETINYRLNSQEDNLIEYLNWINLTNSSIEISEYRSILKAIISLATEHFQKFSFLEYANFNFLFIYDIDNSKPVNLVSDLVIQDLFIEKRKIIEDLDSEIAALYKTLDLSFLIKGYPDFSSLNFMVTSGMNFKFIGPFLLNKYSFLDIQVFDQGELKFIKEEEKSELFKLNIKEQDFKLIANNLFTYLDSLFIDKRRYCNLTNVSNDFTIKIKNKK